MASTMLANEIRSSWTNYLVFFGLRYQTYECLRKIPVSSLDFLIDHNILIAKKIVKPA